MVINLSVSVKAHSSISFIIEFSYSTDKIKYIKCPNTNLGGTGVYPSSVIIVDELTKRYGRVEALRKVSFEVGGGVTGLIGPNGAGKSTLIKILLGLIAASQGETKIFGLDSHKDRDKILERVGVLHEKPRFPSWVTAREYLEHVAQLKRLPNIAEEVDRVSEMCSLGGFIDRKTGTFSAGMVQRLGLADALIGKPELVILDEPTANLDPLGRFDVLTKIKRLKDEENMNFLFSTHILSELERVCDNIIILNEGSVLAQGSFSELTSKYASSKYRVKVDDPVKFVQNLSGKAASLQVVDDFVLAEVKDGKQFMDEVNDMVKRGIIVLEELTPLSATLEDIFIETMRRKPS
jgi:ABC-2 type transport system ATP-binding protein